MRGFTLTHNVYRALRLARRGCACVARLQDTHLIDKLAHFDRERIPERVVHAKGAGAHGYFEVTHDISSFCRAKMFDTVGKRTPCFARFSTVGGEKGSADTARDPRGFAVKFYTGALTARTHARHRRLLATRLPACA